MIELVKFNWFNPFRFLYIKKLQNFNPLKNYIVVLFFDSISIINVKRRDKLLNLIFMNINIIEIPEI